MTFRLIAIGYSVEPLLDEGYWFKKKKK
jgi:hypothetical protein